MPRNSDFPDYEGISVSHADNWDALKYHAPKSASAARSDAPKEQKVGGFQPIKGMVSPRKKREHNPQVNQDTLDATTKAAMSDWKTRGISNNEIIDY